MAAENLQGNLRRPGISSSVIGFVQSNFTLGRTRHTLAASVPESVPREQLRSWAGANVSTVQPIIQRIDRLLEILKELDGLCEGILFNRDYTEKISEYRQTSRVLRFVADRQAKPKVARAAVHTASTSNLSRHRSWTIAHDKTLLELEKNCQALKKSIIDYLWPPHLYPARSRTV